MTLILECDSPTKKHRWVLRQGELARIGQSPWVEFSVAEDMSLSQEHFSISYLDQIIVQSLIDLTIDINGRDLLECTVNGNTTIKAGDSSFVLTLPTHVALSTKAFIRSTEEAEQVSPTVAWESKRELFDRMGFSAEAILLLGMQCTSVNAVRKLFDHAKFEDAIRLTTVLLPLQESIQWCHQLLLDQSLLTETPILTAIEHWLKNPSEENRAVASLLLDNNKLHSSPQHWLLAAIVWTNGSLAPADASPVKPPIDLVWSAIITSINLTASMTTPIEFRKAAVEKGIDRITDLGEETIQQHLRGIA